MDIVALVAAIQFETKLRHALRLQKQRGKRKKLFRVIWKNKMGEILKVLEGFKLDKS